jgi:hypothetical protein
MELTQWSGGKGAICAMFTCCVCHFIVDLDDVVIPTESRRCICMGCYLREAGVDRVMPKALWRDVLAAARGAPEQPLDARSP